MDERCWNSLFPGMADKTLLMPYISFWTCYFTHSCPTCYLNQFFVLSLLYPWWKKILEVFYVQVHLNSQGQKRTPTHILQRWIQSISPLQHVKGSCPRLNSSKLLMLWMVCAPIVPCGNWYHQWQTWTAGLSGASSPSRFCPFLWSHATYFISANLAFITAPCGKS